MLERLLGRDIDSIIFVQDYLQISFQGPRLTCWVWPIISDGDRTIQRIDGGYCDTLCRSIGRVVVKAYENPREALFLEVSDGTVLRIPLTEEEQTGPEFAMLSGFEQKGFFVWR